MDGGSLEDLVKAGGCDDEGVLANIAHNVLQVRTLHHTNKQNKGKERVTYIPESHSPHDTKHPRAGPAVPARAAQDAPGRQAGEPPPQLPGPGAEGEGGARRACMHALLTMHTMPGSSLPSLPTPTHDCY